SKVLISSLYGAAHPYGHIALGTESSLRAIQRDDLLGYYLAAFTPANSALVMAGDLTESEARRLAEDSFGGWSGAGRPAMPLPTPASAPERVLIVDLPGSTQTYLLAG